MTADSASEPQSNSPAAKNSDGFFISRPMEQEPRQCPRKTNAAGSDDLSFCGLGTFDRFEPLCVVTKGAKMSDPQHQNQQGGLGGQQQGGGQKDDQQRQQPNQKPGQGGQQGGQGGQQQK